MKLSFNGIVDFYNNSRIVFSTVSSLQDSRRSGLKKEQLEIIILLKIKK